MSENDDLAPWEQPAAPSGFTLEQAARRLGHYAWAEMRIFEILGAWTLSIPEPAIASVVGSHANEHAWHAELWHRRYPELREWNRDEAVTPASAELVAFFDAIAELESTSDRLVAAYRVLIPHLIAAYSFHRNRCSTVADAPTIRSLNFALADDSAQLATAALILGSTISDAAAVADAAATQQSAETLLVASGGIAGPGTLV